MFHSLRTAFREAVRNFRAELDGGLPAEGELDRDPLAAARNDYLRARQKVMELDQAVDRVRTELAHHDEQWRTTLRRMQMAERIGDHETARVAAAFGERHERRRTILQDKLQVLQRERDDVADEVLHMRGQIERLES